MSKWEDTILTGTEFEVAEKQTEWADDYNPILDAQAEKSFKAGYKQSRDEMDIQLASLADLCLEHRKGGIQEVVDDFKTVLDAPPHYRLEMFFDILDSWQVGLTKRNISEPEIDEAQELADLRHNASDDTIG